MSATGSALVLSWVAILALAFVAAGLFERVAALERLTGAHEGRAPESVRLPRGPVFEPDGRPLVLVLASPSCTSCADLIVDLDRLIDLGLDVRLLWENTQGDPGPAGIESAIVSSQEVARLGASATPFAVIRDVNGAVAWSGAVADIDRLIGLTESVRTKQEGTTP